MERYRERIALFTAIILCVVFCAASNARADIIYDWSSTVTTSTGHMEIVDEAWDDGSLDIGEISSFSFTHDYFTWYLGDPIWNDPWIASLTDQGIGQIATVWFGMNGVNLWSISSIQMTWMDNYNLVGGQPLLGSGEWQAVASPESVPEPTTLALMGLGLFGIAYRRRGLAT